MNPFNSSGNGNERRFNLDARLRPDVHHALMACRPLPVFDRLTPYLTAEQMDNVYKNFTSVNASEFLRAEIPPLGRMTPTEALTDPRFYLETVHLSSVTDSRKKFPMFHFLSPSMSDDRYVKQRLENPPSKASKSKAIWTKLCMNPLAFFRRKKNQVTPTKTLILNDRCADSSVDSQDRISSMRYSMEQNYVTFGFNIAEFTREEISSNEEATTTTTNFPSEHQFRDSDVELATARPLRLLRSRNKRMMDTDAEFYIPWNKPQIHFWVKSKESYEIRDMLLVQRVI